MVFYFSHWRFRWFRRSPITFVLTPFSSCKNNVARSCLNIRTSGVQSGHFSLVLRGTEQTATFSRINIASSIFEFSLLVQSELGYRPLIQMYRGFSDYGHIRFLAIFHPVHTKFTADPKNLQTFCNGSKLIFSQRSQSHFRNIKSF